jgi:hypothetical protein
MREVSSSSRRWISGGPGGPIVGIWDNFEILDLLSGEFFDMYDHHEEGIIGYIVDNCRDKVEGLLDISYDEIYDGIEPDLTEHEFLLDWAHDQIISMIGEGESISGAYFGERTHPANKYKPWDKLSASSLEEANTFAKGIHDLVDSLDPQPSEPTDYVPFENSNTAEGESLAACLKEAIQKFANERAVELDSTAPLFAVPEGCLTTQYLDYKVVMGRNGDLFCWPLDIQMSGGNGRITALARNCCKFEYVVDCRDKLEEKFYELISNDAKFASNSEDDVRWYWNDVMEALSSYFEQLKKENPKWFRPKIRNMDILVRSSGCYARFGDRSEEQEPSIWLLTNSGIVRLNGKISGGFVNTQNLAKFLEGKVRIRSRSGARKSELVELMDHLANPQLAIALFTSNISPCEAVLDELGLHGARELSNEEIVRYMRVIFGFEDYERYPLHQHFRYKFGKDSDPTAAIAWFDEKLVELFQSWIHLLPSIVEEKLPIFKDRFADSYKWDALTWGYVVNFIEQHQSMMNSDSEYRNKIEDKLMGRSHSLLSEKPLLFLRCLNTQRNAREGSHSEASLNKQFLKEAGWNDETWESHDWITGIAEFLRLAYDFTGSSRDNHEKRGVCIQPTKMLVTGISEKAHGRFAHLRCLRNGSEHILRLNEENRPSDSVNDARGKLRLNQRILVWPNTNPELVDPAILMTW